MKTLLALLLAPSLPALAAVNCSGTLTVPGGFLQGSCTGASCSAFLPNESASGTGYCDGGVSVRADGYRQGGFVNGQCMGTSISLYLPSEVLALHGACSDGKTFSGQAQSSGGFASGTCSEGATFSVFLPAESFSFRGVCE